MKTFKIVILTVLVVFSTTAVWALKGRVASEGDIVRLKKDLKNGNIKIGQTRLNYIRDNYGEAASIIDTARKITYDYGELRIEFDKRKYWKDWDYDTFKEAVYTDDVDNLRFDLESEALVGDNVTYARVLKDYSDPTESNETDEDGQHSVYYWGDIMMKFENTFTVRSWRGQNLDAVASVDGVLTGGE